MCVFERIIRFSGIHFSLILQYLIHFFPKPFMLKYFLYFILLICPVLYFIKYINPKKFEFINKKMGNAFSCRKRKSPVYPPSKMGKRVVIISDTHGVHRKIKNIPYGDILIHAGDFTRFGNEVDVMDFNEWLGDLPHKVKIVVEGNHENNAAWKDKAKDILDNAVFLKNEKYEYSARNEIKEHKRYDIEGNEKEIKVNIWGKSFFWNMKTPNPYDDLIEQENGHGADFVDIIISHNPIRNFVDNGRGCESQLDMIKKYKPRLFVCGHIHTARGALTASQARKIDPECGSTVFVNGAMVTGGHEGTGDKDAEYLISGDPIVVDI